MANFPLVGVQFRSLEERETFAALEPNAPLLLKRDPGNAYDPNAIKVIVRQTVDGDQGDEQHTDLHIGFIAAVYAKKLAPMLEEVESGDEDAVHNAWFVTAVDKKSGIVGCDFSVD